MSDDSLDELISAGHVDEAVELALERPTPQVVQWLRSARALEPLTLFKDRWLAALPPLERLQAAALITGREQLLACHAAAAGAFARELRDFWSFTDSPDSEVAPAIMQRLRRYADQVEGMSFVPKAPEREPGVVAAPSPAAVSPFDDDPPFEPPPVLPAAENELMSLIASGRQTEALQLALAHRGPWVETRLDYDAVDTNDDASSAFLQAWLPALPPLERLEAASWASSNFQLALVHLPHAYGIGARLLLEALAAAAICWAGLVRDLAATTTPQTAADSHSSRRLLSYADQLEAMSFDPIPVNPED